MRHIRKWYIIGLTCIALLTVTGQGIIHGMITSDSGRSHVINLAGRQRMLSQMLAKQVLAGEDHALRVTLDTWTEAHDGLIHGSESLGLPPTREPHIRDMYTRLDPLLLAIQQAAEDYLSPINDLSKEQAQNKILQAEPLYLELMNKIVFAKSEVGQQRTATLKNIELFLGAITLLILLLEALLIFEPLVRQLKRNWVVLEDKEKRFRLAVAGSKDAIWDWDLDKNQLYMSPRLAELLGESPDAFQGVPDDLTKRISSQYLPGFQSELTQVLADPNLSLETEIVLNHADGSQRWFLCRAAEDRDEQGRATRLVGSLADITSFKRTQERLKRLAELDELTGLANRKSFTDAVELTIARRASSPDTSFAVAFLDFDRFKLINDSLGHAVGDALHISIADRLHDSLPNNTMTARFGGDEFALLLTADSIDTIKNTINELMKTMSAPHNLKGHTIVSTASIGLVLDDARYQTAGDMLRDADTAMYEAKAAGRAQTAVFDTRMHEQAVARQDIERDLLDPEVTSQMQVAYQPVISLVDGSIKGFESLVRWHHPQRGIISPAEFIPIAEESGAILSIGTWVFEQTLRQLSIWDNSLGTQSLTIAINLSRKQVLRNEFVRFLANYAEANPERVKRITLEITETAIIDERVDIVPTLKRIRSMGYQLAMDDFGTGYSSLSCLNKYPIDTLKIDRSFIMGMESQREFTAVVSAIVSLAHALNLELVAEGVESDSQLAQLQAMDCDHAQGYLFSKPLTNAEATDYLNQKNNPGQTQVAA
ncbi:MAG: EAL domain-containing protein [Phycisphaeraceae bacterium]